MPRVTDNEYLKRHCLLQRLWQDELLRPVLGGLDPMKQWDLHTYYQSQLDLDDVSLFRQRDGLCDIDASLPQRAGKAIRHLLNMYGHIASPFGATTLDDALESLDDVQEALYRYRESRKQHDAAAKNHAKHDVGTGRRRGTRFRLAPIANPELDADRYAKVLLRIARQQLREQKRQRRKIGSFALEKAK